MQHQAAVLQPAEVQYAPPPRLPSPSSPPGPDPATYTPEAAGGAEETAEVQVTFARSEGDNVTFVEVSRSQPDSPTGTKPIRAYGAAMSDALSRPSLHRSSVRSIAEVPIGAVHAAIVVAANAILMALAEIVIEILVLAGAYPKIPFRLDFFFLTILSGLLGIHAVQGMRHDEFDTSMNALQVSALVETALIAGDIKFMIETYGEYVAAMPTRVPFAVLTFVNLTLVSYLAIRLQIYHRAGRFVAGR